MRERPRRPGNVRLVGQMQGSAFVEQPWLVQRDNRFIQVPELLYRVAEAADGHRTLDQIADHLTQTTDWIIGPELVRQVIETKLAPIGIVVLGGDAVAAVVEKRPTSPMSIQLRTKMLGSGVIDPVSSVFQVFFWPPVLIATLIGIGVAHWWVYVEHGILNALRVAMFTPGFLPLSLLVLIVANIFHEFGHAAALHYSGGKVRGMGAGIYLIWPMLYTDVTDSYRLGRWGRLRTDLGGVYFHLIAALGIVGIYLITGHEYLLVTVLLISMQVVAQFVPFARLDGYWVIADLTGIPDFFSQIKPFLRSILPGRRWKGSQLPPMKRWAKVVFATYIITTIPLLALLLALMVRNLPRVLAMSWEALLYHRTELRLAWMIGDVPMMFAIVVQILFLLLQFVGVGLILYGVGRIPVAVALAAVRARRWRLAGTVIGAMAALFLAVGLVWFPQPGATGGDAPPEGVQRFAITDRTHVDGAVRYEQSPPVAGNHAPVWQTCGFYDAPIASEHAVHTLEHGAVWITYRPDVAPEQVAALRQLAEEQTYILVSPYPNQVEPIVATAWNHQLRLSSTDDPRLDQFIVAFRRGSQAPEPNAPCIEGTNATT